MDVFSSILGAKQAYCSALPKPRWTRAAGGTPAAAPAHCRHPFPAILCVAAGVRPVTTDLPGRPGEITKVRVVTSWL